jgi:hypothetical protein
MIETAEGLGAELKPLDFLHEGQTIALGDKGAITIDYLQSCIQERISGGSVAIGASESSVTGGHVTRTRVDCDGGELQLNAQQSDTGGVAVYRAPGGEAKPALTVFSTMPMIVTSSSATVTITRVDQPETLPALPPPVTSATRAALDFAAAKIALAPGGVYRVSQGGRAVVFKVAPGADAGDSGVLRRLVVL